MQPYQSPYGQAASPYGGQPAQQQTGPHGMPQVPVPQTPGLPYHPPEQLMPQAPGVRSNYNRARQVLGTVMWTLEGLANKEPHIQNLYLGCSNAGRGYGGPMFVELVARSFYYVYDVEMNNSQQGKPFDNDTLSKCVSWVVNSIAYMEAANNRGLLEFIQSVPEWNDAAATYTKTWPEVVQRINFAKGALANSEQMPGGYAPPGQPQGYGAAPGYGQPPGYGHAPGYGQPPGYGGHAPPAHYPTPPSYTNGAGYQQPPGNYGGGGYGGHASPGMAPIAGAPGAPVAGNSGQAYHNNADDLGLSSTRYDDEDGMSAFRDSESDSQ